MRFFRLMPIKYWLNTILVINKWIAKAAGKMWLQPKSVELNAACPAFPLLFALGTWYGTYWIAIKSPIGQTRQWHGDTLSRMCAFNRLEMYQMLSMICNHLCHVKSAHNLRDVHDLDGRWCTGNEKYGIHSALEGNKLYEWAREFPNGSNRNVDSIKHTGFCFIAHLL